MDGGDEALAGELRIGTLGLERGAVGVHDFEIADDAGAIAVRRQFVRPKSDCRPSHELKAWFGQTVD